MQIEQPVRGKGLPYWSPLHEALAAFYQAVAYDQNKEANIAAVRAFLETLPGRWLVEAVHGEVPAPSAGRPMTWTRSKPTKPGFYWLGSPEVTESTSIYEIRISPEGEPLWAVQIGPDESDPGCWKWEPVGPKTTHWCGPIPEPKEKTDGQ